MSRPLTEIILVTWNSVSDTVKAIESTLLQIGHGRGRTERAEIIVVDNGSRDSTAETISRRFPMVRLVRLEKNRGFTGGVAAGLAACEGELAILLNNDAIPEPGWLESSVDALRSAPVDVIGVGGKMIDMARSRADFVKGVMTFDGHGFQPGFGQPLDQADEPDAGAEILFGTGGNMIVRTRAFLELGGFDDDYFAYLEDVDFGWRAWLSGYRILWNPDSVVRHKSSATSNRLGDFERGVLFERNALQTVIKNFEDDLLSRFSGPIFLTLLHRLHRYTIERNSGASSLSEPPLDQPARDRGKRGKRKTIVDDPLTTMQFRAIEWFFTHQERVMEKRAAVQKRRRRPDREIFERFPLHYVPTYHGDERLFSSSLFRTLRDGSIRSIERTLEEMTAP